MKAATSPAPISLGGTHKTQVLAIAAVEFLLGVGMLTAIMLWVYEGAAIPALDDLFSLFKPSLAGKGLRTIFQSQVLLLMGIVMTISAVGLYLQRAWAWVMAQTVAFTVLVLSIQTIYVLVSQGSPGDADAFLLPLMVLQGLQIGVLLALMQKAIRTAMRISVFDIIVAALFACILALDWNVTLYMLQAPRID
jgi:hypothetical protein